MITSGLTYKARFPGNGAKKVHDAHKYRGSLKSSMGSITQIYSSTQGEHTNINKTLAIERHSRSHIYINKLNKETVMAMI
jgi:hypothetical protein